MILSIDATSDWPVPVIAHGILPCLSNREGEMRKDTVRVNLELEDETPVIECICPANENAPRHMTFRIYPQHFHHMRRRTDSLDPLVAGSFFDMMLPPVAGAIPEPLKFWVDTYAGLVVMSQENNYQKYDVMLDATDRPIWKEEFRWTLDVANEINYFIKLQRQARQPRTLEHIRNLIIASMI